MRESIERITILGLGWLGLPLAKQLQAFNYPVIGSKTSSQGVEAMAAEGIEAYLFNATENFYLKDPEVKKLFEVESLIITLPPKAHHPLIEYFPMIRAMAKTARYCGVKQLIFTSSISVYGEASGELTESSEILPISHNARVLAQIEQFLLAQRGMEINILRLGGLVSDGRHPIRHLAGREEVPNPNGRINLLHQTDAINAIIAMIQSPKRRNDARCYNLVAPNHPTRQAYYEIMAKTHQLPAPQFAAPSADDPQPREIISRAIREEYEFQFHYPDPYTMPF